MSQLSAEEVELENAIAEHDYASPPSRRVPPGKWIRDNLFNSALNTVITIVFGTATIILVYLGIRWVINEDWKIVRDNLRLFMIGQFPRDELWRHWASGYALVAALSVGSAAMAHNAYDDAVEKGLPADRPSWIDLIRRFWPVALFVIVVASITQTLPPKIGVLGGFALLVVGRTVGWALPASIRARAVYIIGAGVVTSLAFLAGTGGLVAFAAGVFTLAFVSSEMARRVEMTTTGRRIARVVVPLVAGIVVGVVMSRLDLSGFGWEDWGGLHLTLFVTTIGIMIGLPIGILLAIGRRSQLPVIKGFSVLFIEFVRGVPLISLLLFSNIVLPLLFPLDVGIPDSVTRAMIMITLFSAAYIAEIVRGGLQAVPRGQTEAAQAQGLSAGKIQRLIVMPQALRAVIPAMVGQFISLFKDTSLLAIIGVLEFFQASAVANQQPDFLGQGLQLVTYSFVAVGYWSFAYTMSKESRRLETRLGVGVR